MYNSKNFHKCILPVKPPPQSRYTFPSLQKVLPLPRQSPPLKHNHCSDFSHHTLVLSDLELIFIKPMQLKSNHIKRRYWGTGAPPGCTSQFPATSATLYSGLNIRFLSFALLKLLICSLSVLRLSFLCLSCLIFIN